MRAEEPRARTGRRRFVLEIARAAGVAPVALGVLDGSAAALPRGVETDMAILSAALMLEHMGWDKASDLIHRGMAGAIERKTVTYDFERQMEGARVLKTSEFASAIIENL